MKVFDEETLEKVQKELMGKINMPVLTSKPQFQNIHKLTPSELRTEIVSGRVALVDVVESFHIQKQIEGNKHRSLADVFFEEPLAQAKTLQLKVDSQDVESLPLLGFVLSLKDSILMEGTRSTCGILANYDYKYSQPTPFVNYLKSSGALILSKGNIPQCLMSMETINNIFGEAINPLNTSRTPGGSSGGDAAQVVLGLCNSSFASDGAGSLRIPAFFCGLTTLKVTSERFERPTAQLLTVHPDCDHFGEESEIFHSVSGLLSRKVEDLTTFTRVYSQYFKLNPYLPPIIWTKPNLTKRIGLLSPLILFEPPAVCLRAFNICKNILTEKGYQLIDLDCNPIMNEMLIVIYSIFFRDRILMELVQKKHHMHEPIMDNYSEFINVIGKPTWLLKLVRRFLGSRKRIIVDGVILSREIKSSQIIKKMAFYRQYFVNLFRSNQVDLALFYGFPPAVLLRSSKNCNFYAIYTFIWNFLDFVAGALPVTRVLKEEEYYESSFNDEITESLKKNMEGSGNLPVGIQVIGLPFSEEKVLEIMSFLESQVCFHSE